MAAPNDWRFGPSLAHSGISGPEVGCSLACLMQSILSLSLRHYYALCARGNEGILFSLADSFWPRTDSVISKLQGFILLMHVRHLLRRFCKLTLRELICFVWVLLLLLSLCHTSSSPLLNFFSPRNQDDFFLKFAWFIFKCPSKAMKLLHRGWSGGTSRFSLICISTVMKTIF